MGWDLNAGELEGSTFTGIKANQVALHGNTPKGKTEKRGERWTGDADFRQAVSAAGIPPAASRRRAHPLQTFPRPLKEAQRSRGEISVSWEELFAS